MADLNALTYCRLVGLYNSVVADTVGPYGDTDDRPDMFKPYMDATITVFVAGQEGRTPELRLEDATPPRTVLLTPIDCVVEAGVFRLKSADTGVDGVDIIAKSAALGLGDTPLLCRVDFGPVRIAGRTYQYEPVTFVLPTVEREDYTAGVHQVVTIIGSPTGGLFRLLYENSATSTLARTATGATVQAALRALPAIGDNVTVTGPAGGPYDVVFTGSLAADMPSPLKGSDSFTGGTSPEVKVEDVYQPVTLDLSTVDRVDLAPSTPSQLVVRMIPDQLVLEDDGPPSLIRFYASGEPIGDPIPVTVDLSADNITDASAAGRAVVTGDAAAGRAALSAERAVTFNVREYGAVGDGIANDDAAIQSAIDAVPESGGTVFIPTGVYKIRSSEGLTCTKPNVRIVGDGEGSVLRFARAASTDGAMLIFTGADNLTVENLTFDGNRADMNEWGAGSIRLYNLSGAVIRNCRFIECPGSGIILYGVADAWITQNYFNGVDYTGIRLELPSTEGVYNERIWIADNLLLNCQLSMVQGHGGIVFRGAGRHRYVNVVNNVIRNPGWLGIAADWTENCRIAGNTIWKEDRASPKGECISFSGSDTFIGHNHCRNDNQAIGAACILVYGRPPADKQVYRNQIIGNRCENGGAGIAYIWAQNGEIKDLIIAGNNLQGNKIGLHSFPETGVTGAENATAFSQSNITIYGNNLTGNLNFDYITQKDGQGGCVGNPTMYGNHISITDREGRVDIPGYTGSMPAGVTTEALGTPRKITIATSANLGTGPVNNGLVIPSINNELSYVAIRGGTVTVTKNGSAGTVTNLGAAFHPDGFMEFNPGGSNAVWVFEVDHSAANTLVGATVYGVVFRNLYGAKNVTIEAYNSDTSTWVTLSSVTNNDIADYSNHAAHFATYVTAPANKTKVRYTLSNFTQAGYCIVQNFFAMRPNFSGPGAVLLPRTGGSLYGTNAAPPKLAADGNDPDIDLLLESRGDAQVKINGAAALYTGGPLGTPISGDLSNCTFPTLNQPTTGNAATATKLATPRAINGVNFDGTADITVSKDTNVQVFTTSGTWTKPEGAVSVHVRCIGPGGGGGAGARGPSGTALAGGGGGGGGGMAEMTFLAADLTSTVSVTVNTGGNGAAGQATDGAAGANGSAPAGGTSFGTYLSGARGTGGIGGGLAAGGGAGAAGASMFSGTAGGVGSTSGAAGANATFTGGGCGGGGGGGGVSTSAVAAAGGNGGGTYTLPIAVPAGGNGANGTAGASSSARGPAHGGSGGGGNAAGAGYNGGGGGNYGGGGGGGGASLNGNTSGAGGKGGDGICVVTTYF